MTDLGVNRTTDLGRILRIWDETENAVPVGVLGGFLSDLESVYIAAANVHLKRIARRNLGLSESDMERYNNLAEAEHYSISRMPLPLVVRDIRIGSIWLELAVNGARVGTAAAVAWSSLWTVGRALRAGPGHLAEWAALRQSASALRIKNQANAAEDELRLWEAEAALARIKAVAPGLKAEVIDEDGNELRGEPPAPS